MVGNGSGVSGTPVVVVLGMHRSGTSLCANMLAAMGADMAETPGVTPSNRRGHWERQFVVEINDRIFALYDRGWFSSGHLLAMPEHYLDDPRVAALRRDAAAWLRPRLHGAQILGLKDPRVARLLPFWQSVFAEAGVAPRYVLCLRAPAQVIRSVTARDDLPAAHAEYRWLLYNAAAVQGIDSAPVCIVPYEDWFTRAEETAERLAAHAGLPTPAARLPASVIDPSLRHDATAAARPMARRLHRMILRCVEVNRFGSDLRAFGAQLAGFEDQVQPLLTEMEVLRASVTEQARVIGDLNSLVHQLRPAQAA